MMEKTLTGFPNFDNPDNQKNCSGIGNQPSGRDDGFDERRGSAGEDV